MCSRPAFTDPARRTALPETEPRPDARMQQFARFTHDAHAGDLHVVAEVCHAALSSTSFH